MGKQWKRCQTLFWGELQNHCRWWLQPWNKKTLIPYKKSFGQPRQHIQKQRHYFANKGPSSQGYGFSSSCVWMWELDYKESWAPKNWCIWTVVLEKTLESPLDCKRSNQSILKKISPECSLEGLMPKLKLQSFGHLMRRADSFEKTLMGERLKEGREGDDRGWGGLMVSLTQWIWVWVNSRSWWWTGRPDLLQSMGSQLDMTERLNWTDWMYVYGGPQKSDALEFMRPFQSKHTHLGALSWEWFEFILSLLFYPSSSFFLVSNWAITFGVSETHGLFITFSLIIFRDLCFTSVGLPLWLSW